MLEEVPIHNNAEHAAPCSWARGQYINKPRIEYTLCARNSISVAPGVPPTALQEAEYLGKWKDWASLQNQAPTSWQLTCVVRHEDGTVRLMEISCFRVLPFRSWQSMAMIQLPSGEAFSAQCERSHRRICNIRVGIDTGINGVPRRMNEGNCPMRIDHARRP